MKNYTSKHTVKHHGVYKGIPVVAKIDLELVYLDGNRLPYFSVTGKIVKMDKNGNMSRFKKDEIVYGAIGDELDEITGIYKDITKMHLRYIDGKAMHHVANGWYFCKQGKVKELAKHLMISEASAQHMTNTIHSEAEFELFIQRWDLYLAAHANKIMEKYKLCLPKN